MVFEGPVDATSVRPVAILLAALLIPLLNVPSAGTGSGSETLDVEVTLAAREAPGAFQLPVLVAVTSDSRPVVGAIVRLSSTPNSAFVPDEGETGSDGNFRSVILTPDVKNETVVAVIARATFKGANESLGSAALLVWPDDATGKIVAKISVSPKVVRAGDSALISVNVSDSTGARVGNATVVVITDEWVELSTSSGLTSANGSFVTVVRAKPSDSDRFVEIRVQAFKRGLRAAEATERIIVGRYVTEASIWERGGGWIVLVVALLVAIGLFLVLHYKYVRGAAVITPGVAPPALPGSGPSTIPGTPQPPGAEGTFIRNLPSAPK